MDTPNILLVVLDTARASRVYDPDLMPNLNRFAEEGAEYTNAYTTAPWSLPSHASLFTGEYTSEHRIHADAPQFTPDTTPLAARLGAVGYRTLAYSNNFWVSPSFGFDTGFDSYRVGWELFEGGEGFAEVGKKHTDLVGQLRAFAPKLLSRAGVKTLANALYLVTLWDYYDSGARRTTRRAKQWVAGSDDPFFAFLNYHEPHLDYDPPDGYVDELTPDDTTPPAAGDVNQEAWAYVTGEAEMDESDFRRLRLLYDAELRYLDRRLGELFDALEREGELSETLVVVTSDHGENLGDHDLMAHQYCLYDTLTHVPLIIRGPGVDPGTRDGHVELRDVYPTLLAAAGVEPEIPAQRDLRADPDRELVGAEYWTPPRPTSELRSTYGELPERVRKFDRGLQAVRTDEWKLVLGTDGSTRLYNIAQDPGEQTDVSRDNPTVVEELSAELESRFDPITADETRTDPEVSSVVTNRLEELGYL
ncbi:MAG: arylsulfatase A-like enzyme [Halovenus sp.]|jgi:arylsulfatase A-like enzyme